MSLMFAIRLFAWRCLMILSTLFGKPLHDGVSVKLISLTHFAKSLWLLQVSGTAKMDSSDPTAA